MKKNGRPRKGTSPRNIVVSFAVTEAEEKQLAADARLAEQSMSALLHQRVFVKTLSKSVN